MKKRRKSRPHQHYRRLKSGRKILVNKGVPKRKRKMALLESIKERKKLQDIGKKLNKESREDRDEWRRLHGFEQALKTMNLYKESPDPDEFGYIPERYANEEKARAEKWKERIDKELREIARSEKERASIPNVTENEKRFHKASKEYDEKMRKYWEDERKKARAWLSKFEKKKKK